jgi:threonylcarbamoyladenosine tRNA methylthiotransferase MtaB
MRQDHIYGSEFPDRQDMRIAFTTLGCKINQYETDSMRQDLLSRGNTIVPFEDKADVYVINTCSVTAKSDYQCRQIIRTTVRRWPAAKIVVTGCYAETRPDELKNMPGVELVIGNRDKATIPHQIMKGASTSISEITPAGNLPVSIKTLQNKTRGFLKIQDGCDNRCSYCIVPLARGGSRSVEFSSVVSEFKRLVQKGCPEVVLTGIHVGAYGSDLSPATDLSELLATLISKQGHTRIRLSSIEPTEITIELISFLGTVLCRHLHIPLQSGDDTILTAMDRHYSSGFYRNLLENISQRVPGIALGADVMVGFPGEGEKEFQNTLELVEQSPLTHLHVFSYSPRPGTRAAELNNQVPDQDKKERSESLRELGNRKNFDFRKKCMDAEVKVVVEDKRDMKSQLLTGITDNYIRVLILGAKNSDIGKEISVRIEKVEKEANLAVIL